MTIYVTDLTSGDKTYTDGSGNFKNTEAAAQLICARIAFEVRAYLKSDIKYSEVRPMLAQAVRRALNSHEDRAVRMSSHVVQNSVHGTWSEVAKHFAYVIDTHGKLEYEIQLAMIAARSAAVKKAVDRAIKIVSDICQYGIDPNKGHSGKHTDVNFNNKINKIASETRKTYYGSLPGKPAFKKLLQAGTSRTFQESVIVLHDMLQIAWDSYDKLLKATQRPLAFPLSAKVGNQNGGFTNKLVTPSTMFTASKYAKTLRAPVEMGPSMTTVRFCQINNLQATTSFGARAMGHPYATPKLNKDERTYVAWAIFSYWTLFYPKSFGSAHCFYYVNNSATQLGCPLAPLGQYPEFRQTLRSLGVAWTDEEKEILSYRRRLLAQGKEQPMYH